jgi:hypothetical protein
MKLVDLIPLQEIDFPNQRAFDQYNKVHKLRPDTKVTVAGRVTTAGRASLNSKDIKGTSVFGKQNTPKDLESSVENHLNKVSGGKGYAQKDDGSGAIVYNMGNGDTPTYTLYMGKEGNKHRVTLEPTYGNDPKKLQGKIDKSFDKAEDAIKFMGDVAKKYRKELEMDDKGGNAKKRPEPQDNDVFDGGVDVLDTVSDLLPPGTGFTNKKTGDKITVQRYDDDSMYVSYDKVPGKELKWPMKQFLKMTANKELQFTPKDKSTSNQQQSYNPAQAFNTKVSKMTDDNQHSAAAVELAMYMDDREAVSKLQQIKKYHDNRGYLKPSEAKERGEIVNNLLQKAQKELSKKDYDLVSSAF